MTTLLTMKGFNKKPDYLCFTANTDGSTVRLGRVGSPTAVTLETSTDGNTWNAYTISTTITLSNIWDKVYFRNTSTTTTTFSANTSNFYQFVMTWSIAASWNITSLINKEYTDTLVWNDCFSYLFYNATSLTQTPDLPATTLTPYCYNYMFKGCSGLTKISPLPATTIQRYCYYQMYQWCTELEQLPKLPALTIEKYSYYSMFDGCSKIKLSTTQTWEYQTEYRIPTTWTWTVGTNGLQYMFNSTWWTFSGTPSKNTIYYTSNTLI